MSEEDRFENTLRNDLEVRASDGTYDRMHRIVLAAHGSTQTNQTSTSVRRFVMSKPAMKLAIAAAVIAAVTLGLFEFLSPGGSAGVVWADVARRVEASRGMICRMRQAQTIEGKDRPIELYTMVYNSPLGSRMEGFEGDELTGVVYADYESGTLVSLLHNHKQYTRQSLPPNAASHGRDATNPRSLVTGFLAGEYRELGHRTIEGVEAEGIEVNNPPGFTANFQVDHCTAQLWVSIDTGYPVLLESQTVGNGGQVKIETVMDQFQWDVEFYPNDFKVEIPPDYTPMELPQQ